MLRDGEVLHAIKHNVIWVVLMESVLLQIRAHVVMAGVGFAVTKVYYYCNNYISTSTTTHA